MAHCNPADVRGTIGGLNVTLDVMVITGLVLNKNVVSDWKAPTAKSENMIYYWLLVYTPIVRFNYLGLLIQDHESSRKLNR